MGDNHLDRVLPFLKKIDKKGESSSILILKTRRFGFSTAFQLKRWKKGEYLSERELWLRLFIL